MEERKRGVLGPTLAVVVVFMVLSVAAAAFLVNSELRAGGMSPKWVYHAAATDFAYYDVPLYIDNQGSLLVSQAGPTAKILSVSLNGTYEWNFSINAGRSAEQGPDNGFYYVDWPEHSVWASNSSLAGFRNLTVRDPDGAFRWDYVADNGTLEIWGIYPDGFVVAMHEVDRYNASRGDWVPVKDELIGLDQGALAWRLDFPSGISWTNPRVDQNGTFLVHGLNWTSQVRYEMSISKTGEILGIVEGSYYVGYAPWPPSVRDNVQYLVRQEFVDNQTSVINAYAFSLINGTRLWKTELETSNNPDHIMQGVYSERGALVDGIGTVYCGSVRDNVYGLDSKGDIQWKKPIEGLMVGAFPSGGVLFEDNDSLKRLDPAGAQVWRHFVTLNGYSEVEIGADETVYYGLGTSIVALAESKGLSTNLVLVLIIVVADAAVIVLAARALQRSNASTR